MPEPSASANNLQKLCRAIGAWTTWSPAKDRIPEFTPFCLPWLLLADAVVSFGMQNETRVSTIFDVHRKRYRPPVVKE